MVNTYKKHETEFKVALARQQFRKADEARWPCFTRRSSRYN